MRIPRPLGTLNFLLAWLVPWRPAFRTQAARSKLSFFVHCRDYLGRHIAKYGDYEPGMTRWMMTYLATSKRGIFVDVGANVGWYSLHAARQPSVETVVAFEPDAFNAWLLDRNLSLNGIDKVIVSNCAVGPRRGSIRLHRYKGSNYGRHSVLEDYGHGSRTVPLSDLDSVLDGLELSEQRVLILKIDVEGYEPSVIAGATRTLARTDVLLTEFAPHWSGPGGASIDEMLDQLHAADFVPHTLVDDEHLTEIGLEELRQSQGLLELIWIKTDKDAAGR